MRPPSFELFAETRHCSMMNSFRHEGEYADRYNPWGRSDWIDDAEHEGAASGNLHATAEDLPYARFAGQQETFLNIRGEVVPLACDGASHHFTDRAVS